MITDSEQAILEEVRALKEANAARYDFDLVRIIKAARERQELSGREIVRQHECENDPTPPETGPK